MSSDEKGISPAHKTSTPTHRSASSSASSQRDSRQSIHILERTSSSSTEPSVSRQLLEPEPVPLSKEADSWEIIEGLKIGQTNVQRPDKHEGFMLKKRKWPLKGWHKRFFVLDNGMLKYSKAPLDIQKGKVHGSIDVGLSVMSIKKKARRIDLDTEEHIYHLKVKSQDWFDAWVSKLRHHRLYRQNEIVRSPRDASFHIFPSTSTAESSPAANVSVVDGKAQPNSFPWQSPLPCGSSLPATCTTGQSKVAAWLQDSEEMDRCAEDLAHCQSNLVELSKLLQNLEILQRTQSAPNFTDMQALNQNAELRSRLNRIHSESIICDQVVSVNIIPSPDEAGEQIHVSLPLSQPVANESRLSMSESVSEFFDAQEVLLSASSSENEASDDESYISDVSDNISEDNTSVADNISRQILNGELTGGAFRNGRRARLPAPCPDTSNINLWNILRNNIGKDLSKVSMPVELNEPLNTLQHLCEEMEYSELLDKASETDNPYERMVLIAAFAVSGYCSTYFRAGSKPFNPVLGETYECIREDKGFRFFSEQVSHHPPISACHCESKNFVFWQDIRWKNKFWGKSMEILPVGTLNAMLPKYGDCYVWNKVTTCIHNILSGRRWIEHYGEVTIRNTKSSVCICKLTFVKVNYWNSNVNEVQGVVMDQEGKVVYRLFGKWHEGLYCGVAPSAKCIWRPGSMPTNYELYYGFTRFAIELNELDPVLKDLLPPTDARFRPDQRFLEEGSLEAAAAEKQRVEELQRSRRRYMEENNLEHIPKFFKKVIDANQREAWVSNDTYWELRKDPGFSKVDSPVLW
ncbi:oxysterol-binding protein-related protein 6 isoform X7 [Eubalaena glacialis]|uniref:oxysterol-binding protein-related protein 6 isoform X7 n=1 Tax=Eubalaena glacialis TaxID=27606 RepID=UPI002A59ED1D|nr:oxysterol-binding protein-related protein 6 isoform X7 [Eubalaena glacialis]